MYHLLLLLHCLPLTRAVARDFQPIPYCNKANYRRRFPSHLLNTQSNDFLVFCSQQGVTEYLTPIRRKISVECVTGITLLADVSQELSTRQGLVRRC